MLVVMIKKLKAKYTLNPKRSTLNPKSGQVMIISVVMLGGILLSAAAIAGLLMIYQIRASNDAVNSAKAVFAADAGIEAVTWCTFKPDCPWINFIDAPFNFDESAVTFKIQAREITADQFEIRSQGLAANGKVVRILETVFRTK